MVKTKWLALLLVRFMAFAATLSAAIVMATSHQNASVFAVSFEAKYSQTPAFKYVFYGLLMAVQISSFSHQSLFVPADTLCWFSRYFVIANAIVSVYGFLVLFLPSKSLLWRLVVAFDLVIILIIPLVFFKVDNFRTSGADLYRARHHENWLYYIFWTGFHPAAELEYFCGFGYCICGKERKFLCRLASHLWPSPKVLWPRKRSSSCWIHRSHNIYGASSTFNPHCPRPPAPKKTLGLLKSNPRVLLETRWHEARIMSSIGYTR